MLKLLLDEHISRDVAAGLRRWRRSLVVQAMADWENANFLGTADDMILEQAATRGLTLVTYDRRTIPLLLKAWAEEGRSHAGVIFVDDKTLTPREVGGLVQALRKLIAAAGQWEWSNRVCFLRR